MIHVGFYIKYFLTLETTQSLEKPTIRSIVVEMAIRGRNLWPESQIKANLTCLPIALKRQILI